jgi:predicted amidohydrolase
VAVLRIALVQLAPRADAEAAIAEAAARDADIVLFPEMWQTGYSMEDLALAEPVDGPFVTSMREQAARHRVAIVATLLEQVDAGVRNTAVLVDRTGAVRLVYAKVHTCAFDLEKVLEPGDDFPVAELDTAAGPVDVGVMICYDREFPESARELMLGGAEVILTPNACDLQPERIGQFRARAYENMVAVAMANYAGPPYDGGSIVFDGMVCEPDGTFRDQLVIECGRDAGVFIAEIDLDALRAYREREMWGDKWRRPATYRRISAG